MTLHGEGRLDHNGARPAFKYKKLKHLLARKITPHGLVTLGVFACVFAPACLRLEQTRELHGTTMGTTYHITYVVSGNTRGVSAQAVEDLFAQINRSLSTYSDSSIISRLNTSTDATVWHEVDPHFQAVFRRALEIHRETGGVFNPAVGPLLQSWGFGPQPSESFPDDATVQRLMKVSSFETFEYRDEPPAVRKPHAESQLDFNAIAEGYAVDALALMIEQGGIKNYLVEIGGEVRASGTRQDGNSWKVGIERPADNPLALTQLETVIPLDDSALATSGTYRNLKTRDGKTFPHILDPRTGYPTANAVVSVSVVADDAMTADAYATTLVVLGLDDGMRFVEAHDRLEAYFITRDEAGNLIEEQSTGFPKSVASVGRHN